MERSLDPLLLSDPAHFPFFCAFCAFLQLFLLNLLRYILRQNALILPFSVRPFCSQPGDGGVTIRFIVVSAGRALCENHYPTWNHRSASI